MSSAGIAFVIVGSLAAVGFAAFTYGVREPKGRGRTVLFALRALALLLLVLLLADPQLRGAGARRAAQRVVLDASLSMLLGEAGTQVWERGIAEARRAAGNTPVLLAGGGVRAVAPDSLERLRPYAPDSRMLPALQSAAEGGAERVLLVTDGRLEDATEIARWLPALGIALDVRTVGGALPPNRAISEANAPTWAEAGKAVRLRAGVAATSAGRSAVVVRQAGRQVARAEVEHVTDGLATVELEFTASGPPQGGLVRYDVALETPDSIPDDDARSVYVFISEKPAGVALVSFDPDWEPRFLHPVIEAALGLPVRTFLRVPAGVYLRAGGALEAGTRVDEAVVRQAVAEADLLVLHGLGPGAPEWAHDAARSARRLILFPGDGLRGVLDASNATEGDWYANPELPASPIVSLLAGMDLNGLPPLTSLQTVTVAEGAWAPLLGGRSPRGGRTPLVLAEERAGRRRVIAPGRGYWRWKFRGGASADVYQRLWGALAGWTVQDEARVAGAAIRPLQRAVPRAMPVRWIAPGVAADSIVLELRSGAGAPIRTTLTPEQGDTSVSGVLPPGHYTYDVRAFADGREAAHASGPLTVEAYTPEFMRRGGSVDALRGAPAALARTARGTGQPLHSVGWVYFLVLALLSAEWILRRRWGLR